jgi:predicted phosphodiesterase
MKAIDSSFIVLGDTQRTSFLERMILRRETNDLERENLFESIVQNRPRFVVVVGDLVSNGHFRKEWAYFLNLTMPLRRLNIPIYPAIGNHDHNIKKHFDFLNGQEWYYRKVNSLALIWLNTNNHGQKQLIWFNETLNWLDDDSTIQNIITFGHHPPFTNSKVVLPSKFVKNKIAPIFQRSSKTRAFISGHNHAFEKFKIGDKYFIVSGGGGGPRHKFQFQHLHYLRILNPLNDLPVQVEVHSLDKNKVLLTHTFFL